MEWRLFKEALLWGWLTAIDILAYLGILLVAHGIRLAQPHPTDADLLVWAAGWLVFSRIARIVINHRKT